MCAKVVKATYGITGAAQIWDSANKNTPTSNGVNRGDGMTMRDVPPIEGDQADGA